MISRTSERTKRSEGFLKATGFTLVELLLVVALMGVVVATLAPQLGSSLRHWQLRQATDQVASMVRALRIRARQEQIPMRFVLDPKTKSYWSDRLRVSPAAEPSALTDPLLARQQLPAELEFSDLAGFTTEGQEHYLVFTPLGRSPVSSVVVKTTKSRNSQALQIEMDKDGTVKISTINLPSPGSD